MVKRWLKVFGYHFSRIQTKSSIGKFLLLAALFMYKMGSAQKYLYSYKAEAFYYDDNIKDWFSMGEINEFSEFYFPNEGDCFKQTSKNNKSRYCFVGEKVVSNGVELYEVRSDYRSYIVTATKGSLLFSWVDDGIKYLLDYTITE